MIFADSNSDQQFSVFSSDLFYVCLSGEAAHITAAAAETEDEGHQKPRPLQSTK